MVRVDRSPWLALVACLTTLLAYLAYAGYESAVHAPGPEAARKAELHYLICAALAACAVRLTPGYSSLHLLLSCAWRRKPRPLPTGPWLTWQATKVALLTALLQGFPSVPALKWLASGHPARAILALGILIGPVFKVRAAMLLLSRLAGAALDVQEYLADRELLESAAISHGLRLAAITLLIASLTLLTYPILSLYMLPLLAYLLLLGLYLWRQSRLPWREYRQLSGLIDRAKLGLLVAVALLPLIPTLDLTTGLPTELTVRAWATLTGERLLHPSAVRLEPAAYVTPEVLHPDSSRYLLAWSVSGDRLWMVVIDEHGRGRLIDPRSGRVQGIVNVPTHSIERRESALRYAFPYLRPGSPVLKDGRVRVSAWIVTDVWLPFLGFRLVRPVSGDPALPGEGWDLSWYPARWRGRVVPVHVPVQTLVIPVLEIPGRALIPLPPPLSLRLWLHSPGLIRVDRGAVLLIKPKYRPDGTVERLVTVRVKGRSVGERGRLP